MIYLDANVFIYAALYESEKGDKARKLIKKVR
jgi:predicted nucleic acid-binding protein